jgi:hypothetical protein
LGPTRSRIEGAARHVRALGPDGQDANALAGLLSGSFISMLWRQDD